MRAKAALLAGLLLAGCSGEDPASPVVAQPGAAGTVVGVLDGTELRLEVADTPDERAVGLMGRTSVPAGTGMVFLYDELSEGSFYMYRVPIPLRATFIRDGRVVSTVVMAPCESSDAAECPLYPADAAYDTVVETDPAVLPSPEPGDAWELRR